MKRKDIRTKEDAIRFIEEQKKLTAQLMEFSADKEFWDLSNMMSPKVTKEHLKIFNEGRKLAENVDEVLNIVNENDKFKPN